MSSKEQRHTHALPYLGQSHKIDGDPDLGSHSPKTFLAANIKEVITISFSVHY